MCQLDEDDLAPAVEDYRLEPWADLIEVDYQDEWLVRTKDKATAELWVDRHVQMRNEFISGPMKDLVRYRAEFMAAAVDFLRCTARLERGARI